MQLAELAKAFSRKDLPESEVELRGEIPFDEVAPYRDRALAHIAEHLELPGFRPGRVPPEVAQKKVGELAVLHEALDLFIKDFYPALAESLQLDVVGRPDIQVTKLAPGNPVGLAIRVTLYPEVAVPGGWKSLHESVPLEPSLPASDEEVAQTIESLRQSRKQGEALPELNDEFAKSVGTFASVEELKGQITKGIGEEKARAAREARRGKLIEKLLDASTLAVPRIFIESELEKIMSQMRDDVVRFGISFDDYLKKLNKTEEALRNEFREQAKKRAKLQLLLNKLAEEERVEADPAAVATEMKHALEHLPAGRQASPADRERMHIYFSTVLRNEKVLKLLEGEK